MAYKTIVVVLQNEEDGTRALECACALAARWECHLVGVHAEPLPMPIASPMGFPDATLITTGEEANRERAESLGRLFHARMAREDFSAEWRALQSVSGDSALSAMESARCADIVVVAQPSGDMSTGGAPDIDTLIQSGGRPLLLVPAGRGGTEVAARRVVLAWNGSREAARAAFDALPFLEAAEEVTVLTVDPVTNNTQAGAMSGAEIATTLSRHGVKATIETVQSEGRSVARTIGDRIDEIGADLLVAGAFSHSRIKEMIFGGTTRSLIDEPPCLSLLSR
ncbi:universal stress protein [Mesorhizobium xinjiangense]|uniref:universal stress protein n=1 Tax=Mesorhizobium xinjiangense TaxID=2678685 RepID=UPI0012ECCD6D|nr:universal stress protein [Mesorhizobium xinjiangense]